MSEIKVNKISPRTNCGTTQLGDAGDTITVSGDLKSNSIKTASGSTLTLGQSGDTVTLASGASQSGFGRTGTVDWDTTPKTATFTAVSGDGFFCNTTAGAFTANLPAGAAGAIVSFADYAATWQTNNLTVTPNGSDKIGGVNSSVVLNTQGQSVTFIYVDGTQGWINTMDSTSNERGSSTLVATGGTILTCGDYKTHVFTGPGTFTVSSASSTAPENIVDYMVIGGGGGGGGSAHAGGGGAGGFRIFSTAPGSNSPLNNSGASPNTSITVTAQAYPITVGAGGGGGGPGGSGPGSPTGLGEKGSDSIFSTVSSAGGGAGIYGGPATCNPTMSGGSGGGQGAYSPGTGTGNTPPVSPPQGNNGGEGASGGPGFGAGGGGGAGSAGTNGSPGGSGNGAIGSYIANPFIGPTAPSYGEGGPVSSTRYFAAGGGGGGYPQASQAGSGGTGGGGDGNYGAGCSAVVNTGSGGGGSERGGPAIGGGGGSGIVMIRYKFQ
jgi:hypothetical protein